MMIKVALTLPHCFQQEAEILWQLAKAGFIVHIRKPESTTQQIENLLNQLSEYGDLSSFTIHYNYELAKKYHLGGVHNPQGELHKHDDMHNSYRNSCSCHSLSEVLACVDYDYVFLSPVFDSISKQGYKASFSPETLSNVLLKKVVAPNVVALGGVDLDKITLVENLGFDGYALLGALWSNQDGWKKWIETPQIGALP